MIQRLFIFLELTKFRISLFATLSAVTGFILAKQGISREIIIPILGVFFLACGACALNQYQERKIDKLMERTKSRPLPSGKLNPYAGLSISLGLIFSGLFILICGTNSLAFSLGLFAVLWYNGVYTFLKRKTAFAALPGALVGAIPPALGWACGGGNLFDPRIWVVAFFFFIWQVPHFWLLFLKFAKDYEKAGLRSLTKTFTAEQLKRIIFIWILSAAASSLLIPMFDFLNFHVIHLSLLVATLWLVWNAASFYRSRFIETSLSQAFMKLNIYAFFVISLLSLDKLLI